MGTGSTCSGKAPVTEKAQHWRLSRQHQDKRPACDVSEHLWSEASTTP